MSFKMKIWNDFVIDNKIHLEGVPLFSSDKNLFVDLIDYGFSFGRKYLKRSLEMDFLIIEERQKILNDFNSSLNKYDGVIYIMYRIENNLLIPLYIGKSEKYGKSTNSLSVNIKDKDKFCRWGYNYAYHMGDLSSVVCSGHDSSKVTNKYKKWASYLFENDYDSPKLKFPVYFWIKAWSPDFKGVWRDYDNTKLTFLEYLLIGVASDLFPFDLLNIEGVNR